MGANSAQLAAVPAFTATPTFAVVVQPPPARAEPPVPVLKSGDIQTLHLRVDGAPLMVYTKPAGDSGARADESSTPASSDLHHCERRPWHSGALAVVDHELKLDAECCDQRSPRPDPRRYARHRPSEHAACEPGREC